MSADVNSLTELREAESFGIIKAKIMHEMGELMRQKLHHRTMIEALKNCKDLDSDINSRIAASKTILKSISSDRCHLNDEIVESDLRSIALQSCENEIDSVEQFHVRARAFRCLKSVYNNLPSVFYDKYYLHVRAHLIEQWKSCKINENHGNSAVTKLDGYMRSCKKRDKFVALKVLSMCLVEIDCLVHVSVFHDFPSTEWSKELLISYLLSINDTWNVDQTLKLVNEIHDLHRFMIENSSRRTIEDILEILIENQRTCRLDIDFIMYALTLIKSDVRSLDVVSREKCFLPSLIDELETLRILGKCEKRKIRFNDDNEIGKLLKLLVYSNETVDRVFAKIPLNTRITELIDFFVLLNDTDWTLNRKTRFLLNVDGSTDDISKWKRKLFRETIDDIVRHQFGRYEISQSTEVNSDDDKNYFTPIAIEDKKKLTRYDRVCDAGKSELKISSEQASLNKRLRELSRKFAIFLPWTNETLGVIERYIACLDSVEKIVQLNNSLDILIEYEIDREKWQTYDAIISESNATNVQRNVHDRVIEETFPGTYQKSLDQLVDELVTTNGNEIAWLRENKTLRKAYDDVIDAHNGKSFLFPSEGPIKDWNEKRIAEWVKITNKKNDDSDQGPNPVNFDLLGRALEASMGALSPENVGRPIVTGLELFWDDNDVRSRNERIAMIKRAFELTSGMKVRDVQLLSVITMLNPAEGKGRLAQINTGEGKTLIIAMIAAYHAMKGHKVDVITSSPLLAIPQSKQYETFFSMLNVSVGHNIRTSVDYKKDVLYGTAHEFQGDILRDEFRRYGTRKGRKFDIAIVDEVDNMLIDGNSHVVYLSSDMPAMGHLETLLAAIYAQVDATARSIVVENNRSYFLQQENAFDENGIVKAEVAIHRVPINGTKREFIEKSTDLHVRSLIRDCDSAKLPKNFPEIKIPNHLRDFVSKVQLKRWIERAIWAKFSYLKDQDYVLDEGKIKIVDAKDTGVVKHNSHWSNGLHQFLEIKHGAKINPESLASNYISNVTFFRRYGQKIYGLTGTLGTNGTKELLCKTYDVDTIVVPPFKCKQHRELSAIIAYTETDWYSEIAKSCLRKLRNGRAALIIMEYIRQTDELEKILKERFGYESSMIKMYRTNADSSIVEKPLESGQVIITTNIAGRGTDVKLSKNIDDNGGLHVCVTFLPNNSRVELQNTGRTARTGNRGTSQFVVLGQRGTSIDDMRQTRAKREEKAMKGANKDIRKVTTRDTIFERFSELTRTIEGRNDFTKKIELTAVEERFAIWKEEHDDYMDDEEKVVQNFDDFKRNVLADDSRGKLIKNAYMHVQIGNKYLNEKRYGEAITEYTLAKNLDHNFAENALYNRGYATIAEYGGKMKKNSSLIDRAIDDFKKARELIEERESSLHLLQNASDGKVFSEHVTHKLNLYNVQKNAIDLAIGPDRDAIKSRIKSLKELKESGKLKTDEQKKEYKDRMDRLNQEKRKKGVIEEARSKGLDIEIESIKLENYLPKDDLKSHDDEIKEFEMDGYIGGFKVSCIPPIDWSAVIGMLALGFGQLIIGAALVVFTLGAGASFGSGLIAEGISDIVTAVKDGIINRTFSWVTWAIEKAISLAVSVASAGLSAMKDVAKTAFAGAKTAASFGKRVLTETVKDGWKIVAKKVGVELAKGIGKQIATGLIDYGIDKTLIPAIQQKIIQSLKGPMQRALVNNRLVKKMLQLDQKNDNRFYEERIMKLGLEIFSPKENSGLVHASLQIVHRVAANKLSLYDKASQVWSVGWAVHDLATLASEFIEELETSIKNEAEKHKIDETTDVDGTTDKDVGNIEQESRSSTRDAPKRTDSDIDLDRLNDDDEKVKVVEKRRTSHRISDEFVNVASVSMIGIIKGKLIAPVVQKGVNFTMDKVTSSIDASLYDEVENFRAHKRIIHDQNEGFENVKQGVKDTKNLTDTEVVEIQKVDNLIQDARNGEPSGLPHLGAISDATGRPIEVYNEEGKLKYVIGESKTEKPVRIQYHESKDGKDVGHYTLKNSREPSDRGNGKNMCLYNVVAAQTGHDPDKLKSNTLDTMEKNKIKISSQSRDIMRLERYSSIKLAMGGARYIGENADDAGRLIRDCDGKKGFKYKKKSAHSRKHASIHGDPEEHLKALSEESKREIHVYDESGKLIRTIDERPIVLNGNEEVRVSNGPPLEWTHHRPPGDATDEYLTSRNGNERPYRFHDPTNSTFHEIAGKQTKQDPDSLKSRTSAIIDDKSRENPNCVESYARSEPTKTGYLSESELNFVTHHALKTQACTNAMDVLNKYEQGTRDGEEYKKQVVHIKAEELNLPKKVFGGEFTGNGEITRVFPVRDVTVVLYHQKKEQNNPNADVHVQTTFPRLPLAEYFFIGQWDISPTDL